MAIESLIQSPYFVIAILVTAYAVYSKFTQRSTLPRDLPWVGLPEGWFSKLRARWTSLTKGNHLLTLAEEKFTRKELACIFPSFEGEGEILLPTSQLQWLASQPEKILNTHAAINIRLQLEYTFLTHLQVSYPITAWVIHKDLTRSIGSLIPGMMDETALAYDEQWGLDTENWRNVGIYDTMRDIIAQISCSVFIGPPACRSKNFLRHAIGFANAVGTSALLLKPFPDFLKPIFGPMVTFPNRWHYWRSGKYAIPIIKKRLARFSERQKQPETKSTEPDDFIDAHIRFASESPNPELEMTPKMIWLRIVGVIFTSLHTTSFTATNFILDLASSPPERGYIEVLRQEAEQALAEEGGKWTKAGLAKLVHMDSAIRESMRLNGIVTRGPERVVAAPNGVTTPSGLHLPEGAHVGIASYGLRLDGYSNAADYDAFRFSRMQEQASSAPDAPDYKNTDMVHTSDTFLQFGHGRWACGGRFFAAAELKLMFAYLVLHYNIKPLEARPPGWWTGDTILPPLKATVPIQRRRGSSTV